MEAEWWQPAQKRCAKPRPKIPQSMYLCNSSVTNLGNVRPLAWSVHCCSKVSRCSCITL